jgi:hypothetical protein
MHEEFMVAADCEGAPTGLSVGALVCSACERLLVDAEVVEGGVDGPFDLAGRHIRSRLYPGSLPASAIR